MIHTGIERYIYTWHFPKGKPDITVKAMKGDKVILMLNNRTVISGVISQIGTKNIELETSGKLFGRSRTYLNWKTIKKDDISDFCVFPKNYQKYRNAKLY